MTNNRLQGLRVLVTRPDPAGSELCHAIEQQGGRAKHFPTIAFAPPPDPALFEQGIAALGSQAWIIFISPQAVYASIPAIRRVWPQFPPDVQFAAIGAGTAKALQAAGYQAVHPVDDWRSEGLLALPAFQALQNIACAVVRGEGGRDLLEQALTERGARVLSVVAYQRRLPVVEAAPCLEALAQHHVDVVICTSYESVQNLKILLGDAWDTLRSVPLIVVSERIKLLAHDLGFQTICVASNASHKGLLTALAQLKGTSHV